MPTSSDRYSSSQTIILISHHIKTFPKKWKTNCKTGIQHSIMYPLSQATLSTLLRAVVSTVSSCSMSTILIPKNICFAYNLTICLEIYGGVLTILVIVLSWKHEIRFTFPRALVALVFFFFFGWIVLIFVECGISMKLMWHKIK